MSFDNAISNYNINIPSVFQDRIKRFCGSSSEGKYSAEYVPFERQVDVWFFSMLYAFNKSLKPVKYDDTYNAIGASILSTDSYRSNLIQLIAVSYYEDVGVLIDPRKVFDLCLGLANAGLPMVLDILETADQNPLWNLFDEIEEIAS